MKSSGQARLAHVRHKPRHPHHVKVNQRGLVLKGIATTNNKLFRKILWQQTVYTYSVLNGTVTANSISRSGWCCDNRLYARILFRKAPQQQTPLVVLDDAVTTDPVHLFCSERLVSSWILASGWSHSQLRTNSEMCFNNELYEIVQEDAVTTDSVLVFCSDTVVGAVTTSSMRLFRKALWQQTLYTYFVSDTV